METLRCRLEVVPEADILHLLGEVDLSTSPLLQAALLPITGNGRHVIVDMSELRYLDGSGLRLLSLARDGAPAHSMHLLIAGPSPVIRRLLELVKLDEVIPILNTVPEAIERCRA